MQRNSICSRVKIIHDNRKDSTSATTSTIVCEKKKNTKVTLAFQGGISRNYTVLKHISSSNVLSLLFYQHWFSLVVCHFFFTTELLLERARPFAFTHQQRTFCQNPFTIMEISIPFCPEGGFTIQ